MRKNRLSRGDSRRPNVFGNALGNYVVGQMSPKAAAPVATSGKTQDGGYFNLKIDGPLFDSGVDMTPIELSDWSYDDALAAGPAVWAGVDPVDELGSGYRFESMVAEQRQMAALYGGGEAAPVAANGQPYERPKVYAVSRDQMFEPIVGTPLPDMVVGSTAARVAGSDGGGFMNWIQSKDALSTGLDVLPVVGSLKSLYQVFSGRDMVTGEPVNRWAEGAGIVSGLIPGGKAVTKGVASVAPNIGKYAVGAYNELKGAIAGLDAHHVGQQALLKKLIPGYDPAAAPSILVPKVGHTIKGPDGIVSRSTEGLYTPRDVLARDISELRRVYPDIPNQQLQQLIRMNKEAYPDAFSKQR